jgi:chromosome segregation ATPase
MSDQSEARFDINDQLAQRHSSYDDTSMLLSLEAQVNAMSAERAELFAKLGVFDTADVISMVEELRAKADTALVDRESVPTSFAAIDGSTDDLDTAVAVPAIDVHHLANRMGDVGPTLGRLQESMNGLDERRAGHVAEIERLRGQIESQRTEIANVDAERARLATRMTSIADAVANLDDVIGADW